MSPDPPFATVAEVERELRRVADRVRAVGPRLASRGDDASLAAVHAVRAGVQAMADLTADGAREPRRPVPHVAPHALADQVLVLGHDLLDGAASAAAAGDDRAATAMLGNASRLLQDLRHLL